MFWEISDILWKCFGFHWLAKLAEIIKTCGKISVFEGPWQRMDVLWNHKLAEVIKKNTKTQKTLENNAFFLPCCSVPVAHASSNSKLWHWWHTYPIKLNYLWRYHSCRLRRCMSLEKGTNCFQNVTSVIYTYNYIYIYISTYIHLHIYIYIYIYRHLL